MKQAIFFLLSLVLCAFADDVIVGTGKNFDELIKKHDKLVVEFYAPWCGHCKKLTPEYEKAATTLKKDGITLVKVDATEEDSKSLASKYGVRGYPTLKIFRDNKDKAEDYDGPREADGIVKYLSKKFGPASVELKSKSQAAEFAKGGSSVIAVLSATEGAAFDTFMSVASSLMSDMDFAHATDKSLVAECDKVADKCGKDTIIVVKDYDEPIVGYSGSFTESKLKDFLEKTFTPSLVEFSREPRLQKHFSTAWRSTKMKLLAFIDPKDKKLSDFQAKLKEVGQSMDDVLPIYFPFNDQNKKQLEGLGASDDNVPMVMVYLQEKDEKYIKAKVQPNQIEQFIKDYKNGKIERYIKSADIPKEPLEDGVRVLVQKNFDEVITNSGKDALIEFYAPWCGHCKKLTPIYAELAKDFASEKNLIIAKLDATANDVVSPEFNVRGFPTLYFWDGQAKKATQYSGDRSLEDLKKFINANAKQLSKEGDEKTEL